VVHVASLRRSHESEVKDSQFDDVRCGTVEIRSNYLSLDVIFLLVRIGILVFCFSYK
jgi:hypothetical protein